ncbi:MAG: FCD domain-containing protein [Bilophila sp.]
MPQNFYFHDRKFHAYLYTIANMPHIQDIINTLNEHIDIFLNTHIYDYDYREESIRHHQNIVDAIREKDAEKLFTNLEANMTIGLTYLHSRLGNKETGHALSDTETRAALRMDRA